jgi:MFS transporter
MLDLRPLRSASFRSLAGAYWVNEFGNWIGEIALTYLTYKRTHSPIATAAFFLSVRFLPALLAPILTARLETLRPRVSLSALYLLEAAFFAGLAVLTHHFSLPAVFLLGALDAVLAITAKALTRGATATGLTGLGLLREGNAILNLGVVAATAASPVIAAALIAWKGVSTALVIDAITFVLTALIIASAAGITVAHDPGAGFGKRARAGVTLLRRHVAVRRLMVVNALFWVFASVAIPIEIVFAVTTLHAGISGYGFLLGAWGVGTVLGGIAFAALPQLPLIKVLGVGLALVAAGYAGLAVSPSLAVACACSFVGGIGNGCGWIALVTAVQERIPTSKQSAVMAILEGVTQLMPAIGFAAGGVVTALTSPRAAYAVSAGGVAFVALALAIWPIDRVRLTSPQDCDSESEAHDQTQSAQESHAACRTREVRSPTVG